jgi:hypothetical protein
VPKPWFLSASLRDLADDDQRRQLSSYNMAAPTDDAVTCLLTVEAQPPSSGRRPVVDPERKPPPAGNPRPRCAVGSCVWNDRKTRPSARPVPEAQSSIPPAEERPTGRKRAATALVALAVAVGGTVFAWRTFTAVDVPVEERDVGASPAGALDDLEPGWTELPPPPDVRSGAATAWTGKELIVWGGHAGFDETSVAADGFAFDATANGWERLSPSPLEGRTMVASAWTGSELLVWGGWRGTYGYAYAHGFFDDGAAYDPAADTWRPLPPAPIEGRAPLSVWTGGELLVWGTSLRVEDRPRDGAAYDPATNSWQVIPEAPIELTDATAVWTGTEMIVFGAALHGGNHAETAMAIGAAYDPATDTWRRIADSDLSPQASTAAWNSREMIAWDYLNASAAYDPAADAWRPLRRVPLDEGECSPRSVAVASFVFGDYCGARVLFDPGDDAWRNVTRRDLSGWDVELVPAAPAFVLLAHDYGDGSSSRMLAYRPGAAAPDEQAAEEPGPFVPDVAVDGGVARIDVTFPDGSTATLSYPGELDLASRGIQPDVSFIWRDEPPARHPILFLHGPPGVERAYVTGEEPTATFAVPGGGEASLWPAADGKSYRLGDISWWLAYRTDSWTALAALRNKNDARPLASSLSVHEAETGMPFATAGGPVRLAEYAGEDEGPVLGTGDTQPDPSVVTSLDPLILLSPETCSGRPEYDSPPTYASTCLGNGNVEVGIYGNPDFIRAVLDGLRVESFSPPAT